MHIHVYTVTVLFSYELLLVTLCMITTSAIRNLECITPPKSMKHRGLLLLKVIGGVGLDLRVVYLTSRTVYKYLAS